MVGINAGLLAVATLLRIQHARARHHVISRGDRREAIFYDDADRVEFPGTLGAKLVSIAIG